MSAIKTIVHEELTSGWGKIIGALMKRVRKRIGTPVLTGNQLKEVEEALKSWVARE